MEKNLALFLPEELAKSVEVLKGFHSFPTLHKSLELMMGRENTVRFKGQNLSFSSDPKVSFSL